MINSDINMEWTFNQKCQLVITDIPQRNNTHSLEILISPNGEVEYFCDRTTPIVKTCLDGLHKYYQKIENFEWTDEKIEKQLSEPNPTWTYTEDIFSICNLRKCTFELEKQSVEEFLNLSKKTCKKNYEQDVKDVLLISIFVLEHLIGLGKFTEATKILDSLNTCNICGDIVTKTCNCNG